MTDLRTAAQQALEVLVRASSYYDTYAEIAALEAALAEPVQEPVAWRWRMRNLTDAPGFVQPWKVTTYYPREQANEIEPLYTAPPQRKPPATIDEMFDRMDKAPKGVFFGHDPMTIWMEAWRAAEQQHGIT